MIYQTYQGQPSSEVHRSRHYLAPTWSWAAIGSHIVYEDGAEILAARFEIVFCDVKLEMQEEPYYPPPGLIHGGSNICHRLIPHITLLRARDYALTAFLIKQ